MIRAPQPSDIPLLVDMGRAFFMEAGHEDSHPGFTFDGDDFAQTLDLLAGHGLLLVADRGDGPVGMAGIDAGGAYWNRKTILGREAFFYIVPAARKGLGRAIIVAMETAAASYGATTFDLVAEPGPRSRPLTKLYQWQGYNPAEITFRKRLTPGIV